MYSSFSLISSSKSAMRCRSAASSIPDGAGVSIDCPLTLRIHTLQDRKTRNSKLGLTINQNLAPTPNFRGFDPGFWRIDPKTAASLRCEFTNKHITRRYRAFICKSLNSQLPKQDAISKKHNTILFRCICMRALVRFYDLGAGPAPAAAAAASICAYSLPAREHTNCIQSEHETKPRTFR